eukprot:1931659-Pyramimonas_sp.AAC.1
MVGAKGLEKLKGDVMSFLPTQEKHVEIEDVAQKLELLQSSDVYQFCSETGQGQVRAAVAAVHQAAEGRAPKWDEHMTDFLNK